VFCALCGELLFLTGPFSEEGLFAWSVSGIYHGLVACIFCSILEHSAPASFIYQDDEIAAFMDIRPIRPGQVLVIPRLHIDHFCDLPDDLAMRVLRFGQRLSRALREVVQPVRVGLVVHGFGVPHAHLNVVPLHHIWDVTSAQNALIEDGRVKFRYEQVPLVDRAELDRMAERIRTVLQD
jgi:histidine triad (HIT) family protein